MHCRLQSHRTKLEQCGTVFNSFNGPNYAFAYKGGGNTVGMGLPRDANIAPGDLVSVKKLALYRGNHGMFNSVKVNSILRALWPFEVCGAGVSQYCTEFPLPVLDRDSDGGILDTYTDGTRATWLPPTGRGVVDYHCTWMILHTSSFNGNPTISEDERKAFLEAILYLQGVYDCKVCRNNFADIVANYGLPEGYARLDYARYFWLVHNVANEHSYATHSPDQQHIDAPGSPYEQDDRRWDWWANPNYEHPWFLPFEDARSLWAMQYRS